MWSIIERELCLPKHWQGDGVITLFGARQDLWKSLRKLDVPIVDLAESRPNIRLPRVTMVCHWALHIRALWALPK